MRTAAAAACLLSAAAATRARALQVTTQLEMYTSRNCSEGTLNATIDLAARNESLCTQCWDRCAEEGTTGFPSMRLRGPGKVAIQGNCAGLVYEGRRRSRWRLSEGGRENRESLSRSLSLLPAP